MRRYSRKLACSPIRSLYFATVSRGSHAVSVSLKFATTPKPKRSSPLSTARIFWAALWWSTKLVRSVKVAAEEAVAAAVTVAEVVVAAVVTVVAGAVAAEVAVVAAADTVAAAAIATAKLPL